jgi:hypothetical protein
MPCISVGKIGEKGPLRRPRYRWEDNIKVDIKDFGWDNIVRWLYLALDGDCWRAVMYTLILFERGRIPLEQLKEFWFVKRFSVPWNWNFLSVNSISLCTDVI